VVAAEVETIQEILLLMEDQLVVLVVAAVMMLGVALDLLVQHKEEIQVEDIPVVETLTDMVEVVVQEVLELLDHQEKVEMVIPTVFWELTIIGLLEVAEHLNLVLMPVPVDLVAAVVELHILTHQEQLADLDYLQQRQEQEQEIRKEVEMLR
jgi:hypothetical protein